MEGKFSCNSEDRWPSESMNLQRGVYKSYVRNLPEPRFATELLEPNDGYIEPCYTLISDPRDPENFTKAPKEAVCLDPKQYLCRTEINTTTGLFIRLSMIYLSKYYTF